MVGPKRKTNWDHLVNVTHLCGPDAELRIHLHNVSPDAEGAPDSTVVVLKCRACFIRAGDHLFVHPDCQGGGKPGRLLPNIWELVPTDEDDVMGAKCLTDLDAEGNKPDVPAEIVEALEAAGFHWEDWAARD